MDIPVSGRISQNNPRLPDNIHQTDHVNQQMQKVSEITDETVRSENHSIGNEFQNDFNGTRNDEDELDGKESSVGEQTDSIDRVELVELNYHP